MRAIEPKDLKPNLARAATPVAVVFARAGFAPSDELVASVQAHAAHLQGRMELLRVDVDGAPELVQELRVHKVPELLVWAAGGGRMLARVEGAMRPDEALDFLEVAASRA